MSIGPFEHDDPRLRADAGAPAFDLTDRVIWLIGPVFLMLAAWFVFASPSADPPVAPAALVARERIAPGARRHQMADPPSALIGGFAQRCNECHRFFDSPPAERRTLTQHTHIQLEHGLNNRCFNCHDNDNRELLALYDGNKLGFDDVPRLCRQCHGPVFRDWERGTHGKTMGSWDASSGSRVWLACNECHDPHAPAYPAYEPLPPPNTMRMGPQSGHGNEGHDRHMPLRRWSSGAKPGGHEP